MEQKNALLVLVAVLIVGASVVGIIFKLKSDLQVESKSEQDLVFNQPSSLPTQPTDQVQSKKLMKQYTKLTILPSKDLQNKKATIQTAKGKIEFEIYPEATKAASNFIYLTKDGFYDGLIFHRVVPGFVIQGGDPLGNGTGGPGYKFEDEPVTMYYHKGVVAMANAGPNTNGSQFFIMLADHPELPKQYTIFGKVISGQDVVDKIAVGDVMQKITIENTN